MKKEIISKLDIYKIKKPEELLKYYQDWTDNNKYNKDMVDWNYTAPQETVSVLRKYALNKNSKILDAGCGTGLVGIELKKYGYSNIEGVDFSQSMLDLVPQNIYQKIEKIDLNKPLKFKNNIAVSLDVKDGLIALSGWEKQTNISAIDFIKKIQNFGVSRIIYTDINKDGTKKGPNIKDTVDLSSKVKIPLVISGGVSSIEDIKKI